MAVLACLLGVATKEIVVTAPLVVLLYDWTFLADSPRQILHRRWGLYLGLAATWGLLAWLVQSANLLEQPDIERATTLQYASSQPLVILNYLRLCFWPHPLCFDRWWQPSEVVGAISPLVASTPKPFWTIVLKAASEIALPTLVIGLLLAVAIWGLARKKPWGFLGGRFFPDLGTDLQHLAPGAIVRRAPRLLGVGGGGCAGGRRRMFCQPAAGAVRWDFVAGRGAAGGRAGGGNRPGPRAADL